MNLTIFSFKLLTMIIVDQAPEETPEKGSHHGDSN